MRCYSLKRYYIGVALEVDAGVEAGLDHEDRGDGDDDDGDGVPDAPPGDEGDGGAARVELVAEGGEALHLPSPSFPLVAASTASASSGPVDSGGSGSAPESAARSAARALRQFKYRFLTNKLKI